jgi:SAM-dependent methyltransferase
MSEHLSDPVVTPGASSHWRAYLRELDPERLTGAGFGHLALTGWRKWQAELACASFAVSFPAGRRYRSAASRTARRMALAMSQDAYRQVLTVQLLERYGVLPADRVLCIGDGYGFLSGLLLELDACRHITLVDLEPISRIQEQRLRAAYPRSDLDFVHAQDAHSIAGAFDVAINIVSFGEMAPAVVRDYFMIMRSLPVGWLYCCNREHKEMPGGEVSIFAEYPWAEGDEHVLDELCPWHQWFRALRPPFRRFYDGPIRHRLTRLLPAGSGNEECDGE